MGWAQTEKRALVETLRRADPEADTLCAGWNTRRLLAHLVQREQDPRGSLGDALLRAKPGQERYLGRLADRAATPEGYAALLARFVAGPPRWSPMSWASEQLNLLEYVIHHEDVRRGGPTSPGPRVLPERERQRIWQPLPLLARLRYRSAPVGVVLAQLGGARATAKSGARAVTLTGEPVELALYTSGRRSAAQVQVSGPPEAVQRFQAWVDQT
jgi:uncharacterized protein (TIGR03085 family)